MTLFSKLTTNFQPVSNFFPETSTQWKTNQEGKSEVNKSEKEATTHRDGGAPGCNSQRSRRSQFISNKTVILTGP